MLPATAIDPINNIVHGDECEPSGSETLEVINPADESVLGILRESTASDVDAAVGAARGALASWAARTPSERSGLLRTLADAMEARIDEFARLEVLDAGKPWAVSRGHEVPGMIDAFRHFAALARVAVGQPAGDYVEGNTGFIRREPVGVVAAITPWNFPLWQALWKIGPALAVGNTVVVKPAENTPLSTLHFVKLAAEVLPPGVLNLVNGTGLHTGAALVAHPDVQLISFTGSTRAGRAIAAAAGCGPKRLVLELGGNAPVIVFDDADVETTAEWLAATALYNAGQECMAATRLIVHDALHDALVDALARRMKEDVVIGDPMAPATTLGPLISSVQRDRVHALVSGISEHASVVLGGEPMPGPGFFYPPTLITGVDQGDEIVQEEVFGPVATVQRFTDEAHALAMANGVEQGLAGSVWTRDVARALRVANGLEFGNVWINAHMASGAELPIGGFRGSGYGKEGGLAGLDEYARNKQVTVNLT